ncbi:MAG: hypothetical protein ACM31D_11340 [Bacteroidota bacterium]
MSLPDFFAQVPSVTVHDPLAAFLGAPADGRLTYTYADAVRLAGHSCPTVAGAWLMTVRALAVLWPDSLPERGRVQLSLPEAAETGVTGVVAAVAGLVTGAAAGGGFKGIGGRFGRAGLVDFATAIPATLGFRRTDTGDAVLAHYDPSAVPAAPEMRPALQRMLAGVEAAEDGATFARAWQERVRCILLEQADAVVTLTPLHP